MLTVTVQVTLPKENNEEPLFAFCWEYIDIHRSVLFCEGTRSYQTLSAKNYPCSHLHPLLISASVLSVVALIHAFSGCC